jgi:hypothetical protein
MSCDNAATDGSEHSVVPCDMPSYCTYSGALKTTFGAGFPSCDGNNGSKGYTSNETF